MTTVDIHPTNATLAAIVHGVDVRTLSAEAFADLEAAWNEHAVLIIPTQHLDDEAHIAFSRRFGSLERLQAAAVEGANPEIFRYSQGQVGGFDIMSDEELDAIPPVEHPIVATHPATGRKSLFIGRHASHIVGEDIEESRALLRSLCADACRGDRVYRHRWQAGDVVIWDNRCVLHRGLSYPVDQPRIMCRTTVAGDQSGNKWVLDTTASDDQSSTRVQAQETNR